MKTASLFKLQLIIMFLDNLRFSQYSSRVCKIGLRITGSEKYALREESAPGLLKSGEHLSSQLNFPASHPEASQPAEGQ